MLRAGKMEFGVTSRGVIEIHTETGDVELTVSNSFAVCTRKTPTLADCDLRPTILSCAHACLAPSLPLTLCGHRQGTYELVCPGCGLSISGAEGTVINEALREKGRLTGSIGNFQGGASIYIVSNTGDVTVKVIQ